MQVVVEQVLMALLETLMEDKLVVAELVEMEVPQEELETMQLHTLVVVAVEVEVTHQMLADMDLQV